jgi:hypothetical protein
VTKLKIELKAQGNIRGLAKHLAKKYGPSDEGFFTRCMAAEELADYPHDNRAAICARAHKVQIGTWPGEKKKKMAKVKITLKGGAGSGHFSHGGRPGKVGGSSGGKGGKKKVGTTDGAKRRAAAGEKRKVATAEHQKKYGKPTGKGTTADGLAAVEYAMTFARPTPAEIKKIRYKVYKKGIKIQDVGGYMGHTSGSVDMKYLKSKFGFTPEKFAAWLDDNGAGKIK